MAKEKYPLEQIAAVKRDRVEKAEKVVEERKRGLEIEQEKMKRVVKERDAVRTHRNDKIAQMRKAFDEGTTSDEILQMKAYLKVVEERLVKEEEKVIQQDKLVKAAEQKLQEAKQDLKKKRMEEEKIKMHKEQWEKEQKKVADRKESIQHDEIGQVIHESHKRKMKER